MSEQEPKVELIPWDCESVEHVERMYQQRVSCGWRSDEVRERWVELTRAGNKALYWVETSPIHDTAASHHFLRARAPDRGRALAPVGHVALDLRPEQDARLGIGTGTGTSDGRRPVVVVWVAGLYVSYALQAGGLGRDTMRRVEEVAVGFPPRAEWVVLDTIPREQQRSSVMAKKMYAAQGKSVPTRTTQDWYERQGYQAFSKEVAGYTWVNPETGDSEGIDYLFMKKRLR